MSGEESLPREARLPQGAASVPLEGCLLSTTSRGSRGSWRGSPYGAFLGEEP